MKQKVAELDLATRRLPGKVWGKTWTLSPSPPPHLYWRTDLRMYTRAHALSLSLSLAEIFWLLDYPIFFIHSRPVEHALLTIRLCLLSYYLHLPLIPSITVLSLFIRLQCCPISCCVMQKEKGCWKFNSPTAAWFHYPIYPILRFLNMQADRQTFAGSQLPFSDTAQLQLLFCWRTLQMKTIA